MRWDAQPVFGQEYRSLVKVREEKENIKTREVKRYEGTETDIKPVRPTAIKVRSLRASSLIAVGD